jgi:hypothetical protein
VTVLGTAFNINSYQDELSVATTLINGSIKVLAGRDEKVLKPGQQANLVSNESLLKINLNPDLRKVLSWQKGMFEFRNASVKEVMRQIARWYDVEIIYKGHIPNVEFGGVISRKVPLFELLELFDGNGLVFTLQGNKLIVTAENK